MKTILVTTDFSTNSKKAVRFAIQLASQNNYRLIFYNITDVIKKPSMWDNVYHGDYNDNQIKNNLEKLEKFVSKIQNEISIALTNFECLCDINEDPLMNVSKQIMSISDKLNVNYICVSTRGSGVIDKLFGTVASELILNSVIPVFIVPVTYKVKRFTNICYASDIVNFDIEMKNVIELSDSLNTKITVLHYDYDAYLKLDEKKLNDTATKYESENILFQYKKLNPKYTLNFHIRKDMMSIKPSLLVLFTKQNQGWFDRLFATHHSDNMSFNTKVPLLIFRKN